MPSTITSKSFRYQPRRLASVSFLRVLRKNWPLLLAAVFLAGVLVHRQIPSLLTTAGVVLATFLAALWFAYQNLISSTARPSNQVMFQEQTLSLTADELHVAFVDGSKLDAKLNTITKVERLMGFTVVTFAKRHTYYVPDGVFESEDDEARFHSLVGGGR